MLKKTLVVAATLALAAATTASASADYDITGGDYAGTSEAAPSFTIGGAYTMTCASVSFTGNTENVPGDPASTLLTPSFSGCEDYLGVPMTASVPDPWKISVVGSHYYGYPVTLGTAGDTLVEFTNLWGCKVAFKGSIGMQDSALSISGGLGWEGSLYDVTYETNPACPYASGADGAFHLNGRVVFPGIGVDEL